MITVSTGILWLCKSVVRWGEYFYSLKPSGMVARVIDKANSNLVNILTHLAAKKIVVGEDHNKSRLILLQICWMHKKVYDLLMVVGVHLLLF